MSQKSERHRILNALAQVNHPGFAGDCIRIFVANAQNKTDEQILQTVSDLQSQIRDNRPGMKQVLGRQFDFINSYKVPELCV